MATVTSLGQRRLRAQLDKTKRDLGLDHCSTCGWVICDCCADCGRPTEYADGRTGEICRCDDGAA